MIIAGMAELYLEIFFRGKCNCVRAVFEDIFSW